MDAAQLEALALIRDIFGSTPDRRVNDVTREGGGDDEHLIVTVDTGNDYRVLRVDVTYLGLDELEHESG